MMPQNQAHWLPQTRPDEAPSAMALFRQKIESEHKQTFGHYGDLHAWSTRNRDDFWRSWLELSGMVLDGSNTPVSVGSSMRTSRFFPNIKLNFAENLLRWAQPDPKTLHPTSAQNHASREALVEIGDNGARKSLTFAQLHQEVVAMAAFLQTRGIGPGSCVAALVPNRIETVIAMLATTALGGIWSSTSPDFGEAGILDRFAQIKPTVLIAARYVRYGHKTFDLTDKLQAVAKGLTLSTLVLLPDPASAKQYERASLEIDGLDVVPWQEARVSQQTAQKSHKEIFTRRKFDHPTYILFSSGTTGKPKCIVHGAGGTLLQHSKELVLHTDLRPQDKIMFFTTCGWMMWNWLVSSLFCGATVVLFDGNPAAPSPKRLWQCAAQEKLTHFGTSPKFIAAGLEHDALDAWDLSDGLDFSALRTVLSTGAPLLPEHFDWLHRTIKKPLQISSISGGTDIISCFALGHPEWPVWQGELQALGLGMDVVAVNSSGQALPHGQKGDLACRAPFPSMPTGFWNDADGSRYKNAYFFSGDNIWMHGDYVAITPHPEGQLGAVFFGRSDATLNPGGIRIGTAELYAAAESLPEIADSLAIAQPWQGDVRIVLFVVLAQDIVWQSALETKIRQVVRKRATPRHSPAKIIPMPAIPYTRSGKKVELAVLHTVCGIPVVNREALASPEVLEHYAGIEALTA